MHFLGASFTKGSSFLVKKVACICNTFCLKTARSGLQTFRFCLKDNLLLNAAACSSFSAFNKGLYIVIIA